MVRVSSPAKLRPWSESTAKMVMGVVPGLVHTFAESCDRSGRRVAILFKSIRSEVDLSLLRACAVSASRLGSQHLFPYLENPSATPSCKSG